MMNRPILIIAGPTGVGKTATSLYLANKLNGEIISADSMQVYKGMNIGTAKIKKNEASDIPHHLIDIKLPSETYSLSDYLQDARKTFKDILDKNKTPIFVGGTGLYISSFINNIELSEKASIDEDYRNYLKDYAAKFGNQQLKELLKDIDSESYNKLQDNDTKRIIRALEVYHSTGMTIAEHNKMSLANPSPYTFCYTGLTCKSREILYNRINKRVDNMIADGLINEVKDIDFLSMSNTARQAIGYKQINEYLNGLCSLDNAIENIKTESRHYAKRQLTWFNHEKDIKWFFTDDYNPSKTAEDILSYYYSFID